MKIKVPQPPRHGPGLHAIEQKGLTVTHIWALDKVGADRCETLYATAAAIARLKGVSRATAYRIIAKSAHRYWYVDMSQEPARVWSVLPVEAVQTYAPGPQGNPGFHSGIYQQDIARRRKKRA